eukprot:Pompholyxophrys_punicea_v1_NODE_1823_length_541_cov_2.893004.p2 type:complete len:107 gc:universal NODE_1823_length_541_cov_2.893004:454-134(-)
MSGPFCCPRRPCPAKPPEKCGGKGTVFITKCKSPGVMSGPWSPYRSNVRICPSGMPFSIVTVIWERPRRTLCPPQCGHCFLTILPFPPHLLHGASWVIKKPGAICC